MKPVLKWVGGKRRLLPSIVSLIDCDIYIEPFLGGGAVFFELQPADAIISDVNEELINFYTQLKLAPIELFASLAAHENTKEYFYELRSWDKDPEFVRIRTPLARASRFLFLNKAAFNGMWRVNSKHGYMNVPYARPAKINWPTLEEMLQASTCLISAKIICESFIYTERYAAPRTTFYLDPPYVPISETESFVGYSMDGFSLDAQMQLVAFCHRISDKGANFVLSNSDCELTRNMYKDFKIKSVSIKRTVGGKGSDRKTVGEILVTNI